MQIESTTLADVKLVTPKIIRDARGFFSETWNAAALTAAGIAAQFVQDNHALSRDRGTIRGMHYQLSPRAQAETVMGVYRKLVGGAVGERP